MADVGDHVQDNKFVLIAAVYGSIRCGRAEIESLLLIRRLTVVILASVNIAGGVLFFLLPVNKHTHVRSLCVSRGADAILFLAKRKNARM